MKIIKYSSLILFIVLFSSGCNPIYKNKIESAYSKLRIGMTKKELSEAFSHLRFLKEQTVLLYPTDTEDEMRWWFKYERQYEDLYPEDIFDKVTFDGNIKVFSYFVKKRANWPNYYIHYIFVFYDEKNDRVVGWGKRYTIYGSPDLRDWGEKF